MVSLRQSPFFDRPAVIIALSVCLLLLALGGMQFTGDTDVLLEVAVIPLGFGLMIQNPYRLFLAFILLAFFRLPEAYPFLMPLKLSLIVGILSLGSLVWHAMIAQTTKLPPLAPEIRYVIALFALVTLGMAFAHDRGAAFDYWQNTYWKLIAICVAIAALANTKSDLENTLWIFLAGGSLVALVVLYNKMYGIGLVEGTRVTIGAEFHSPLADPNDLALILLSPLSLAVALFFNATSNHHKALAVAVTVLIAAAIVATQSRGAILGIMAILAVIGQWHIKSSAIRIGAIVVCALALVLVMGIGGRASGGFAEVSNSGIDESSRLRLIAWRSAINMAVRNPLNGVGLANFGDFFFFYTPEWVHRRMVAHSAWFEVLGEAGLPGLVVFVTMIAASFRSALSSVRLSRVMTVDPLLRALSMGMLASLVAFCVAASFLANAFSMQVYLLIGIIAATTRFLTKEAASAGTPVRRLWDASETPRCVPHLNLQ